MSNETKENFPYSIVDLNPEQNEELIKYFHGETTGFVRVGPKGYLMQHKYRQEASKIYNMDIREGDTFVASYPRSGTTWTQELVWMVLNDMDYATAKGIALTKRYTFLEVSAYFHPKLQKELRDKYGQSEHKLALLDTITKSSVAKMAVEKSPRFCKTHLPLSLLPPTVLDTAQVVYVARDPRDVAVSYYHLNRTCYLYEYVGDFKTFWHFFIHDRVICSPYFEHLKEFWEMRNHPNMLFLFYEDLTKNLPAAVHRVAEFFNKKFTAEQVAKLCDHLCFENFKKNESVNLDALFDLQLFVAGEQPFIRKGKAGGWRAYFDEEMEQQADRWMADNLRDTDLRFPHIEL